ncbi:hypothetical protein [Brachybacterium paraconglomeratum]|nr:hypothetical protein [Brachybacterium paraconglomeratum]
MGLSHIFLRESRSASARWLLEHGFDPDAPGCEFDVLRARMRESS